MTPIDIRADDLDIVINILRLRLPKNTKVWVFGSRARNKATRGSDLDLAIDAGRPLTTKEKDRLSEDFYQSDLSYKVDVVDMQTVSDSFRPYIDQEKVPLTWEKDTYFNEGILINAMLFACMAELLENFLKHYQGQNVENIDALEKAKKFKNRCLQDIPKILLDDFYEKFATIANLPLKSTMAFKTEDLHEEIQKNTHNILNIVSMFKNKAGEETHPAFLKLMEALQKDMKEP